MLTNFSEVIVLDNGSTDNTIQIAKTFKNTKVFKHTFIGFGALKRLATSYTKNDWILSIDSDEILSNQLQKEIGNLDLKNEKIIFSIKRDNYYKNKLIKGCGWDNDYVLRLFNKNHTSFNERQVHESLIIRNNSCIKKLNNPMKHYSFDNVTQLINKMQFYSTLWAKDNKNKKQSTPIKAISRAFVAFIKNFILQKGFLYGYEGLVISISNANGVFYKYIKLYELSRKTVSLIITTYNWENALELVLDSVKRQTYLPHEVIIADDGSTNKTKMLIENYQNNFPTILIHSWQEDNGFRAAQSRNKAISKATGEYIILIDGDMILHKDFVKDHISVAKKGTFVQGGRVLLDKTLSKKILRNKIINFNFFQQGLKNRKNSLKSEILSLLYTKKHKKHKGIKTCNFAFFKDDCIKTNGFNEDFTGWGREDSEFAVRLFNNNIQRRNLKFKAIAYHIYHEQNSRDSLDINDKILLNTINKKLKQCKNGIDKYI